LRITQNRRLFRAAILIALILGIASSSSTNSNGSSSTTTDTLHVASTIIFLVVTVLQAVQTIFLANKRVSGTLSFLIYIVPKTHFSVQGQNKYFNQGNNSIGVRYGNYILLMISLLLVVREAFATATVKNTAKQDNEHFWYPFLAITEILAVSLFTAPGLVPRQDEVPEYSLADVTPHYNNSTPYARAPYATDTSYATNTQAPYAIPPYAASHAGPTHYGA
jgi:hypothetical protein